jgi:hypothetical protein
MERAMEIAVQTVMGMGTKVYLLLHAIREGRHSGSGSLLALELQHLFRLASSYGGVWPRSPRLRPRQQAGTSYEPMGWTEMSTPLVCVVPIYTLISNGIDAGVGLLRGLNPVLGGPHQVERGLPQVPSWLLHCRPVESHPSSVWPHRSSVFSQTVCSYIVFDVSHTAVISSQ